MRVTDFIFLGSKITALVSAAIKLKGACSFGRKAMTNLESVLKYRDITVPTKVHIAKLCFFSINMCECESWTINMTEH